VEKGNLLYTAYGSNGQVRFWPCNLKGLSSNLLEDGCKIGH
jgi:hypothetical protein